VNPNHEEYCDSGTWRDQDFSQTACEACGTSRWNIGGDLIDCCQDDVGEFIIEESDSPIQDPLNSDACCDAANKCVDDNGCYIAGDLRNLEEDEQPGVGDQGDIERCTAILNDWEDADDSQANCEDGDFGAHVGTCTLNGGSCWIQEGENANFAGYDAAALPAPQISCCGDDSDEHYIESLNLAGWTCCDNVTDFVHTGNQCSNVSSLRFIYGYITGEMENGTYEPLSNTLVRMLWPSSVAVNEVYTDANGWYNISIPTGYDYLLTVFSPQHNSPTIPLTIVDSLYLNLTLEWQSNCERDCSTTSGGEHWCFAGCDGYGGCIYNTSVTSTAYGGASMKDLCDGKRLGWPIEHNDTYDIICCNVGYRQKIPNAIAAVDFGENVKDAQTFYAGAINYDENGQLYGVYVIVYDTEE